MGDNSYKVINIDINDVLPNRFQPRIQFNEEEILELSDSIKEHGVIQPLVVRSIGNKYEIIAGERRYKASVLAGLDSVPVIIKELNDKESAEIALIENIQRKNLSAIEEAISYKKIIDMSSITQEELAKKIGKSQSAVANKIRLLNLSDEVQDALLENKISERHARSLLRLKEVSKQNQILDKIIEERLTVRKTDEEINKILSDNFKIEKEEGNGEEKMNNESSTTPTVVIPPSGNFDIFGSAPVAPVATVDPVATVAPQIPVVEVAPVSPIAPVEPVEPVAPIMEPQIPVVEVTPVAPMAPVEPVEPVAPIVEPQIPVVEVAPVSPVAPVIPEVPVAPIMEPQIPVVEVAPVAPVAPVIPEVPVAPIVEPQIPVVEVAPVAPVIPEVSVAPVAPIDSMNQSIEVGGFQFDANGNVIAAPSNPITEEVLETPVVPEVPVTPIIEPQISDLNSINPIIEENATIPELATSPIIVTDYSKQYDPIMPQQEEVQPITKSDFKEVINLIRECSSKIEQYGYRIDLEEYDLSTIYQVVFKIEK